MGFRVKEDRISVDDVFKNYERANSWNVSEHERQPPYRMCAAFAIRIKL